MPYNFTIHRILFSPWGSLYHYFEHLYYPNKLSKWIFQGEVMHLEHHFGRLQPVQLFDQSDHIKDEYKKGQNQALWDLIHGAARVATDGSTDFDFVRPQSLFPVNHNVDNNKYKES